MIRHTASAVFTLRDGFTGLTLTGGAVNRCFLDGRQLNHPLWKREGYLVLLDLTPGVHELLIRRAGYRDELVTFPVAEGAALEDTIALKPGRGYRFPESTVRVSLGLKKGGKPAAGAQLWLGIPTRTKLKLAQEKAESGDGQAKIFCEGNSALLPIPGHFLLSDKKAPELAYLRSLIGETGEFSPALSLTHGRGTELIPMQTYTADGDGTVQVLLREPGTLVGFFGGRVFEARLSAGSQELNWELEG